MKPPAAPSLSARTISLNVWFKLTEGVDVLPDGEREAAAGAVDAEEDHGDVLRGAHASPRRAGVAVVHVALVQRQRVVLGAGELLSLHHPAVEHLHRDRGDAEGGGTAQRIAAGGWGCA